MRFHQFHVSYHMKTGPSRQLALNPSVPNEMRFQVCDTSYYHTQWRIQRRGTGGPPPLIFRPNWGPKNRNFFFLGDRPPPPLPKGLDDLHPPSSPLISGSGSGIDTEVSPFTTGTNRTNRPFYSHRWKRHWSWPCFDTTLSALLSNLC